MFSYLYDTKWPLVKLPRHCTGQTHETSHQNLTSNITTEVRLTPAALQVTLPMLDEQAAATVKTNPAQFWNGCCSRVPNPALSLQAIKYPLVMNNLTADEVTRSVFALFCVLAAQTPASHASSLQNCFLSLSVPHADSRYFESQTKVWSQPA